MVTGMRPQKEWLDVIERTRAALLQAHALVAITAPFVDETHPQFENARAMLTELERVDPIAHRDLCQLIETTRPLEAETLRLITESERLVALLKADVGECHARLAPGVVCDVCGRRRSFFY